MQKSILTLTVLFLLVSFVSAFELTQDTVDVAVIPELTQAAKVPVTINGAEPGNYMLYTLTAVKVFPSTSFYLNGGKNPMVFDVYPTNELIAQGPAAYAFAVELRNTGNNQIYKGTMSVRVVRIEDALTISSESNSPDSNKISFYIQNKEGIDLNNVHAKFSSVFFNVDETFSVKGNSKTEISIDVPKSKMEKIEAGSYLLKAEVQTDRGVRNLEGRIYLGEKVGVESKNVVDGWLIRTNDISKINYGNVNENIVVDVKKDIISRLFTSFSVEPDSASRNGAYVTYVWSKKLGPAESFNVKVKTNYLFPILIIIAILLVIITIRRYTQTKLEIVKTVVPVKTSSGQFALRIKLLVKARRNVSNVSLVDRIPGIVQIYEKFSTIIKPTKIDANNRRIQWDIGDMNSGEERMFNYVVYSTVGVVGKFALPQALAVFEKDGKIHEVESNAVYFLAEQRSAD
ncbi:MAG: hypothetical protein WCI72_02255 [archaeon]